MNLTETPDTIRFSKLVSLSFDNPAATTFVVLPGGCVLASKRPHQFIYNALRICTGERPYLGQTVKRSGKEALKVLKDYESWVAPGLPLSEEAIDGVIEAQKNYKGNQQAGDFWRSVLVVGRLWKNVKIPEIGVVSAMSFWLSSEKLTNSVISALSNAFKVTGPLYVETLDSSKPDLYNAPSDTFLPAEKRPVSSSIAPHLSKEEIFDIVARAHNAPWTLNALEREVAAEWYGKGLPVPGTDGGYSTRAELNFRKTIGDSVIKTRFLDLFEKHP